MRSAASTVRLFVLLFAFAASPVAATEHVVTSNADSGAGSLRQAIADAANGDTITFNLSAGQETITIASDLSISGKSLSILGHNLAGSGTPITIQVTSPGESDFRVFDLSIEGKTVTLQDLTLKGGNVAETGSGFDVCGGGIKTHYGTLDLTCVTVTGSRAAYGGGIYGYRGVINMTDCTISDNETTVQCGGGLYVTISTLSLERCTIHGNHSNTYGGGLFNYESTSSICNSTFSGNTCNKGGGAVYLSDGNIAIDSCTIANNHSDQDDSGDERAGGVYMVYTTATLTVKNTVLANNHRGSGTNTGDDYFHQSGTLIDDGYNVVGVQNRAPEGNEGESFNSATDILYNTTLESWRTDYNRWNKNGMDLSNQTLDLASSLSYAGGYTEILAVAGGFLADAEGTGSTEETADQRGYHRVSTAITRGAYQTNVVVARRSSQSWDQGYASIAAALAAAEAGETVQVVGSVVTESGIAITRSVTVEGQGAGVTVVQASRTVEASTNRVFDVHGDDLTVTLASLTVRHGRTTGSAEGNGGAGIRVRPSESPNVVTLRDVEVCDNRNESTDSVSSHGGGVFVHGVHDVRLQGCDIHHNIHQYRHGAGLAFKGPDTSNSGCFLIENTEVHHNACLAAGAGHGGGIYTEYYDSTTLSRIEGCAVYQNTATEMGGGVSLHDTRVEIVNSTIAANTACGSAGGLQVGGSSQATLTGVTVAENRSDSDGEGEERGGGVHLGFAALTVRNTILAHNLRGSGSGTPDDYYYSGGTLSDQGYNIVEIQGGVSTGSGKTFTAATDLLGVQENLYLSTSPAENGGPTRTLAVTSGESVARAIPASAGEGTFNGCGGFDQRGYYRSTSGNRTIGAYEYGGVVPTDGDFITCTGATGAWSSAANWYQYNGTTGAWESATASPTSADERITVDTGSQISVDSDVTVDQVIVASGGSLSVSTVSTLTVANGTGDDLVSNGSLTVSGGLVLADGAVVDANGSFNAADGAVTFVEAGNLKLGGSGSPGLGTFTAGTGTVWFDGASQTIPSLSYYGLRLVGSGTATLVTGVDVNGALVVGGTVSALSSSGTLTLSGTADFGTRVSSVGGTVVYDGSDQSIDDVTYANLTVDGTGTATLQDDTTVQSDLVVESTLGVGTRSLTVNGSTDINGTLTISTGTVDLNGAFDASGGNVVFTGAGELRLGGTVTGLGTFTAGTGTVRYDRAGDQTVQAVSYHNLTLTGSGTRTLAGDISITGLFTIDNVTFLPGEHTVTYAGSGDQTIASGFTYYDLTVSGSGTETVSGALTVSHTLAVGSSSVLDVNGALTVNGTISNSGTIRASSTVALPSGSLGGTFVYDGADQTVDADPTYEALTLAGTGTKTFPDITTATGGVTVDADLIVTGADENAVVQAEVASIISTSRVFTIPSGRTVTVTDLRIRHGSTGSGAGGGILNGGTLTLERVVVSDNRATGGGGGIHVTDTGTLAMQSCTVSGNMAGEGPGGGIRCEGTLSLTDCTVTENSMSSASHAGGGVYLGGGEGSHTIEGCTISGNSVSGDGGGVGVAAGVEDEQTFALDIVRTTIAENRACGTGGGLNLALEVDGGTAGITLNACTVAHNNADYGGTGSERGGGVYLGSASANVTVKNTLLARNYRGSGTETRDDYYYSQGTLTDRGYNVVESQDGASSGVGKTFTAATDLLGVQESLYLSSSLADNGGPTRTLAVTGAESVARAIPASAGEGTYNGCGGFDQRGYYRSTSGNRTIGAYEYGGVAPSDGDFITCSGATGVWSSAANWYCYNGTTGAWESATMPPTSTDGRITVDTGSQITVESDVTVDQVVVASAGFLTVAAFRTLTVANGSGDDLVSNGSLTLSGVLALADGALVDVNSAFNATNGAVTFAGDGDLKLGGTGSSSLGTLTAGTGTVWFDGASQTVPAVTYHGLRLEGSGTATLVTGIDVNGALVVGGSVFALSSTGTLTLSGTANFGTQVSSVGGTVVYDGAGQTVDDLTYSTLRLTGTGTVALRDGVTVESALVVGGSVSALSSTGTLTLSGTVDFGSEVSSVGGTVVYDGVGQSIDDVTYADLTVDGTGTATLQDDTTVQSDLVVENTLAVGSCTLTVNGSTDINGTVTVSTGTVDVNGAFDATGGNVVFTGAGRLQLGGAVTSLGTFTRSTSTVVYDGGSQTVQAGSYHNLTLNGSGTKTLAGPITIAGLLTVDGVTFAPGEHAVTYAGTGDQTVASGVTYYDLTLSGSGTETASGALTVSHTLTVGSSSVLDANGALTVNGSIANSGTIRASSTVDVSTGSLGGTFVYDGAGQTVDDLTYSTLRLTGTGTVTLRDGVTVESALVVGSSISALSSTGTLTLGGTVDFGSEVTSVGGTVVYDGSDQSIEDVTYTNLTVDGTGTATLQDDTTVQSDLVVESTLGVGSYTLTVNGSTDINGTVTVSTGTVDVNGAFDATGGNVVFTGAGRLQLGGAVTGLGTFTCSTSTVVYNGGSQTVPAGSYHDLMLTGSGTKTLSGDIAIAGLFTIDNVTFAPGEHAVTYAGSGDQTIASGVTYYDLTLSSSGTGTAPEALTVSHDLTVGSSSVLDVNGALTVNGTISNSGTIRASSTVALPAGSLGGTFVYDGEDQTVDADPTYSALTLAGSGTKTVPGITTVTGGVTVDADLTVTGADENAIVQAAVSQGTGTSRVFTIPSGRTVTVTDLRIRHGCLGSGAGGGISNGGALTLTRVVISDNRAAGGGGGIHVTGTGSLEMQACTVSGNTAGEGPGGGIRSEGTLSLTDCTVADNTMGSASHTGGGIHLGWGEGGSSHTIEGCTICGNQASGDGGGVSVEACVQSEQTFTLDIVRTTIAGNAASGSGGGLNLALAVYGGTAGVNLNACTVARNNADSGDTGEERGGGVYLGSTTATLEVRNTLLARNARGSGTETRDDYYYSQQSQGTLTDQGYNVVESQDGASTGAGKTFTADTDLLGVQESLYLASALAENGGLTRTLAVTSAQSVAKAIPASAGEGTYNGCGGFDQRGYYRSTNGNRTIGAYECSEAAPAAGDFLTRPGATGSWSSAENWYRYNGTTGAWERATESPTSTQVRITVDSGGRITVDSDLTADRLVVATEGTLIVAESRTLTVASGDGDDLVCDGNLDIDGELRIADGAVLDVNGGFDATGGAVTFAGGGDLKLGGESITSLGTFTAGTGTVWFDRAGNQTVPGLACHHVRFSGGAGTKTLGGALSAAGNLAIDEGSTFSVSGSNHGVSVGGDWSNQGTFTCGEGTVTFNGSSDQSITGSCAFYDLTIANTHATARVDASGATSLAVSHELRVTDGTFYSASDYHDVTIGPGGSLELTGDITVSGDWSNQGTLIHNNHAVILDGTDQAISGATTFYDLTKNVTSGATLTFTNGSAHRTTVTHALDFQGVDGGRLSLRSASTGSAWEIDPQGTHTVAYLDVEDSTNVNATAIDAADTGSVNSGRNTNWVFADPAVTTQAVDDITMSKATAHGTITALGDPTATQHGVCWSRSVNPTIADRKTEEGAVAALGSFTSSLTGLAPGYTYYLRAYVTSAAGTFYGEEVTFETLSHPWVGASLVPASVLLFPIVDSRNGRGTGTLVSVTNTNTSRVMSPRSGFRSGDVQLHYYYVGGPDAFHRVFDRKEFLTPGDTLTVFAGSHNPEMEAGYLVVVSEDPESGAAIQFNDLIGDEIVVDVAENKVWAVPAVGHRARVESGPTDSNGRRKTDANANGKIDFDGVEYDFYPDHLYVGSFFEQSAALEGQLILVSGLGGLYRVWVNLLIYDNEEESFSRGFEFTGWTCVSLQTLSQVTARLGGAASEPAVGWMRIDGDHAIHRLTGTVWSGEPEGSSPDPPLQGAFVQRVRSGPGFVFGHLLHHSGTQNGYEFP